MPIINGVGNVGLRGMGSGSGLVGPFGYASVQTPQLRIRPLAFISGGQWDGYNGATSESWSFTLEDGQTFKEAGHVFSMPLTGMGYLSQPVSAPVVGSYQPLPWTIAVGNFRADLTVEKIYTDLSGGDGDADDLFYDPADTAGIRIWVSVISGATGLTKRGLRRPNGLDSGYIGTLGLPYLLQGVDSRTAISLYAPRVLRVSDAGGHIQLQADGPTYVESGGSNYPFVTFAGNYGSIPWYDSYVDTIYQSQPESVFYDLLNLPGPVLHGPGVDSNDLGGWILNTGNWVYDEDTIPASIWPDGTVPTVLGYGQDEDFSHDDTILIETACRGAVDAGGLHRKIQFNVNVTYRSVEVGYFTHQTAYIV